MGFEENERNLKKRRNLIINKPDGEIF